MFYRQPSPSNQRDTNYSPRAKGNQPNDSIVGKQSIAAGQRQAKHHALSNRSLPTFAHKFNPRKQQSIGYHSQTNETTTRSRGHVGTTTISSPEFSSFPPLFSAGRKEQRLQYGRPREPDTKYYKQCYYTTMPTKVDLRSKDVNNDVLRLAVS